MARSHKSEDQASGAPSNGRGILFALLSVLLVAAVGQAVIIAVLVSRSNRPDWRARMRLTSGNPIARDYPYVDFQKVYPGLSAARIDLLQRECFNLPYIYEPYVGFKIKPARLETVEVAEAGFRVGGEPKPWPPDPAATNIFVFGGSATFGYGVATGEALPDQIEAGLRKEYPAKNIRCYNFGCGYYFSPQERLRFEQLLLTGHTPAAAIFVTGLNDYVYWHGRPKFTEILEEVFQPGSRFDLPPLPASGKDRDAAVEEVLARLASNISLTRTLAAGKNIPVLFIGQPTPFADYERREADYPFKAAFPEHELLGWGYVKFRDRAKAGAFGDRFIWCGDAFLGVPGIMYADSIHYTPEGNRRLARVIVERAIGSGLLLN